MMLDEFAKDPFKNFNRFSYSNLRKVRNYFLEKYIRPEHKILDVGQCSPLKLYLESYLNVKMDSTRGDLDSYFAIPSDEYNIIIFSHTIEHIFDPLQCLLRLKAHLKPGGIMYILLPDRGKLLWTKGHYHEINGYSMSLLLKRAGLKILSKTRYKPWRTWWHYLTGFRPILRLFFEFYAIYEVRR